MSLTTKNKHTFSRWFVCNIDQPLARIYLASGVPTACFWLESPLSGKY